MGIILLKEAKSLNQLKKLIQELGRLQKIINFQ